MMFEPGGTTEGGGFRLEPHTADLIVEAWAPTRAGCYRQSVLGLVASFADASECAATEPVPFEIEPASDEGTLVALLEEAIYVVDVFGAVPASVEIVEADGGALSGFFDVARDVTITGSAPKAIAYSNLEFEQTEHGWRSRFMVDV